MKTILAALVALGLAASVASARPMDNYFTKLNDNAPHSSFDQMPNTSARSQSFFDKLNDNAPRSAPNGEDMKPDLAGE